MESQYLDGRASLTCSDVTAADIDSEVMKLLHESYKKAKKLLKENREIMDKLAAHLIEKETITGKEFMKIYRKEKGIPEPAEEEEGMADKAEQSQENAVKPEAQSQPAAQQQGMANPMGQPQSQPVPGFQMPPMAGAGQQGGMGFQMPPGKGAEQSDGADFQTPPVTGAQQSGGAQMQSGQEAMTDAQSQDGARQQNRQPAGPRGLFSQAPDPGHTSEDK